MDFGYSAHSFPKNRDTSVEVSLFGKDQLLKLRWRARREP